MTSRRFPDEPGCQWMAWSVRPDGHAEAEPLAHVPAPLRDGWLVFMHGMERRRLYPIPDGWWREPEAELCRLLDSAESVRAYAAISFPG